LGSNPFLVLATGGMIQAYLDLFTDNQESP
jgi:hypothetical protein